MTVHVHRQDSAVGYGNHHHEAPPDSLDRTWSFDCTPECETRILRDVEHTGRNEASVPLTVEEVQEQEALETMGKKDVTQMAMAMTQWAKGQAKEQAATSAA
jgi:hypothetical protein